MIKTDYKCPKCNTRMWFIRADKHYCKHCKMAYYLKFELKLEFLSRPVNKEGG